ncbi:hypothetical protein [Streptomyces sp. SCL15-4]|uniref:hypothetical protein n=1 Tax=Streptomyces sp. SCL15-4 TaxID=2967221 RepID=UPI002966925A|nr:hypothetical protein [Streptomyces sp. SCL15-4]
MIRYRNENTGDVVERDAEDARLEALPNWTRLRDDETPGPVRPDGVLSRPQASPGTAPTDPDSPRAREQAEAEEQQEDAGDPPAKNANKDVWIDYALKRAVSDEEREEIPQLTKELLIAKYGEEA